MLRARVFVPHFITIAIFDPPLCWTGERQIEEREVNVILVRPSNYLSMQKSISKQLEASNFRHNRHGFLQVFLITLSAIMSLVGGEVIEMHNNMSNETLTRFNRRSRCSCYSQQRRFLIWALWTFSIECWKFAYIWSIAQLHVSDDKRQQTIKRIANFWLHLPCYCCRVVNKIWYSHRKPSQFNWLRSCQFI